ncbi:hypothetical protein MMC09_000273, partial [Bachmanniomyces sp. S44760]|nr:hypothetical protein [Bachmanniomyces sp. S44760]
SDSPDHHIQSLVYYLLQDLQHTKQSAETYARKTFLPNQYETFIDGLWNLDRLYPEKALDNLTSPSLIPTFPEEILYTLCQLSLPSKDSTLPLAYYHTVNPAISSPKVQDAFFSILCRASITEAFYWSRTHDEFLHRRLFEKLIAFVHSDATGQIRSGRAIEMMCLPLGNEEKGWFEDFVTDGKGKTLPGIKDTIIMWKMIVGDKKGLKEMGPALNGKKVDGMTWGTLVDGLT